MKKKILIIIVVIIIFICSLFLVANKLKKENNNDNKGNDNQAKSYEVIDENANEDYKTLLKLVEHDGETNTLGDLSAKYETITCEYKVDINKLKETIPYVTYNNDNTNEELKNIVAIIKEKFNITIDDSWKYIIHYPASDLSFGYIIFIYYINDNIATDRYISFNINNGVIDEINYAYLDRDLNENEILYKYNYFINHYRQEKGFVKDYEKWYTIAGDKTSIVYHFNRNKIAYGYVIFYKYKDLGAINNDWGIEMFIEPELIENFINTKKIIVKDNNDKEIKTIENKETITKITELMARTIPALNSNQKSDKSNELKLFLYDKDEKLINSLDLNENGILGLNNAQNEYLKETYLNELLKIIK